MSWFERIRGIAGDLFQFDNGDGAQIKNNSGIIEVRDSTDANMAILRAAGIPLSSSDLADIPDLLDLRGRIVDVEFDFTGASAPSPGANTDTFGFCHTSGGSYTAGDIVFDNGSALVVMPSNVATHLTSRSAVTGGISLIQNGIYARQGVTWTLKGDGTPTQTGHELAVAVDYDFNDEGTPVSSSTEVPDGAVITRVTNSVSTLFNDSATTLQVDIDGTADETVMATADSKLKFANEYSVPQHTAIVSGTTGPVRVTIAGGSPTAGEGQVIVHYVTPLS